MYKFLDYETIYILALVSCIAFAKAQTKYSIKIIGEDFKPIPSRNIMLNFSYKFNRNDKH